MTTNKIWRTLARQLSRAASPRHGRHGCSIQAAHDGPIIAVAGHGSDATMLCVRHALAWAESDLCQHWATNNSNVSLEALSVWIADESAARAA
jgi:hypothetical protein